jgi:hypothetical protein
MYKLLIIIQLGAGSHSSQVVEFQSEAGANYAAVTLNKQKTAYNVTILKMY